MDLSLTKDPVVVPRAPFAVVATAPVGRRFPLDPSRAPRPAPPADWQRVVTEPKLDAFYPAALRAAKVQGVTIARLVLRGDGQVARCVADVAEGAAPFSGPTCDYAARIRFAPVKGWSTADEFSVWIKIAWHPQRSRVLPMDAPVEPRLLNGDTLMSSDDYPPSAIFNGEEGAASVVIDVLEGVPTGCVVTRSSGSIGLDDASCWALMRARFTPFRDEFGRPAVWHYTRNIKWVLPTEE